jgi:arginyl-tRNA synthetase
LPSPFGDAKTFATRLFVWQLELFSPLLARPGSLPLPEGGSSGLGRALVLHGSGFVMNLLHLLSQQLAGALTGLVDDPAQYATMIKPTQDARHGDYQANCAMPLQRVLGQPPRTVAQMIVDRLDRGDLLAEPEIAGPGFINLRLRTDWLARQVQALAGDGRLGIAPKAQPRTIVIDFSSPNVAKPMHVGHLRSSIIGEALTRLLRFLGNKVITDNHLGDWGLQFGMLLHGYKHHLDEANLARDPVQEMVRLYLLVRKQIKAAEMAEENLKLASEGFTAEQLEQSRAVLAAVRAETSKLHAGDQENRALWEKFMPWCLAELEPIYRRLDIHFDHMHGESFYEPMLADVVRDLLAKGIAHESDGAVAVFFDREGEVADTQQYQGEGDKRQAIPPALVRYRNGAYTYTTSDLATIRHRMEEWHPEAILYVVGTPQALHFRNLFAIARCWGYDRVELEHIAFGSVLDPEGQLMRTREGGAPLLEDLLAGAIEQAARVFERLRQEAIARGEEVPDFSPEELRQIHEIVGIGAVKYADLCQNRISDYRFDLAKMTATDGNTATYMQYAYARNRSILRKGEVDEQALRQNPPLPELKTPQERALALALVRYAEVLNAAAADYRPSQITTYLWDLAKTYSGFFQNCPVLKAETPELRQSRLLLCDLTARVIRHGLELLGIQTLERM